MTGKPTYEELEKRIKELKNARDELHFRDMERAAELAAANEKLKKEIAECKRAEETLQSERDYISHIINNTPAMVCGVKPDGTTTFINPAGEQITGYSAVDLIGRNWWQLFYPDVEYRQVEQLFREFEQGEVRDYEMILTTKDSDKRIISWNSLNKFDNNGKLIEIIGFGNDITEKKRTEEDLHASRKMLQAVLDTIPARVFWKDSESKYLGCNIHFAKDAGLNAPDEIIGKDDFQLKWHEQAEMYRADDRQVMESGKPKLNYEEPITWPDGTQFWVKTSKIPLLNQKGDIVGMLGSYEDITERKRAEEALRESEALLQSVFRSAPTGIGVVSNRILLWTNEKLCQMTGYSSTELNGQSARMLYPNDEAFEWVGREKYALIKEHGTGTVETQWQHKDGTVIDILLSSTPIDRHDSSGGVTFTALDITERKKAEEALRESEEKFAEAFMAGPDCIIISRVEDGKIVDINEQFLATFGYTRDEVIGKTSLEIRIWADEKNRKQFVRTLQDTKEVNNFETYFRHKNENIAPYLLSSRPIEVDGEACIISIARDITERKQAEEKLNRFKIMLDHTLDCIFMFDPETLQFNYLNQGALNQVGYSREELSAMTPVNIKPDYTVESFREMIAPMKNGLKASHTIETVHQHKNGTLIPVEIFLQYVTLPNDTGRFVAIVRDITERRQAEAALQKAHDDLEQRVKERTAELQLAHDQLLHTEKLSAIGKLSASIAHEFNNPLFGIRNVLKGIKHRASLDEDDSELVDMALQECDRIKYLIQDLQDFNRPTSGVMAPLDVHKAIDSILLLFKKELKEKKITVKKQYAAKLPMIQAVPDQIRQVLLNLIRNSGDAIQKGKGTIAITTEVLDENKVAIHIKDSGAGIKQEDQDHIFEPFFSTKPDVKGTGLGLSVSYGIIKKHNGNIEVKSEIGKGSTFTIILPIENPPE